MIFYGGLVFEFCSLTQSHSFLAQKSSTFVCLLGWLFHLRFYLNKEFSANIFVKYRCIMTGNPQAAVKCLFWYLSQSYTVSWLFAENFLTSVQREDEHLVKISNLTLQYSNRISALSHENHIWVIELYLLSAKQSKCRKSFSNNFSKGLIEIIDTYDRDSKTGTQIFYLPGFLSFILIYNIRKSHILSSSIPT